MASGRCSNGGIRSDFAGVVFFHVQNSLIQFQRGYWDKLSFLRIHNLPLPSK